LSPIEEKKGEERRKKIDKRRRKRMESKHQSKGGYSNEKETDFVREFSSFCDGWVCFK
jgi:hypothetical protein